MNGNVLLQGICLQVSLLKTYLYFLKPKKQQGAMLYRAFVFIQPKPSWLKIPKQFHQKEMNLVRWGWPQAQAHQPSCPPLP